MSPTTVEIEGYGPVQVRGLAKGRIKQMGQQAGGDGKLFMAYAVRRGVTDPRLRAVSGDKLIAEFADRPDALRDIAIQLRRGDGSVAAAAGPGLGRRHG